MTTYVIYHVWKNREKVFESSNVDMKRNWERILSSSNIKNSLNLQNKSNYCMT